MGHNPLVPYLVQQMRFIHTSVGDFKCSARSNDMVGWLLCDGRSLDPRAYPALFEVIGYKFGASCSSEGAFKIPDFRGRVYGTIGGGTGLTARTMGQAVGEESHLLTVNEMPVHGHGGSTSTNGQHNHGGATGNTDANSPGGSVGTQAGANNNLGTRGLHSHSISPDGNHAHTISNEGGGASHNVMQPTLFAGNFFIFAGDDHKYVEGGSGAYTSDDRPPLEREESL
jgi:microcystin-dependent protein